MGSEDCPHGKKRQGGLITCISTWAGEPWGQPQENEKKGQNETGTHAERGRRAARKQWDPKIGELRPG